MALWALCLSLPPAADWAYDSQSVQVTVRGERLAPIVLHSNTGQACGQAQITDNRVGPDVIRVTVACLEPTTKYTIMLTQTQTISRSIPEGPLRAQHAKVFLTYTRGALSCFRCTGDIVSYQWRLFGVGLGEFLTPTAQSTTIDFPVGETRVVGITVTDSYGNTSTDFITVTAVSSTQLGVENNARFRVRTF